MKRILLVVLFVFCVSAISYATPPFSLFSLASGIHQVARDIAKFLVNLIGFIGFAMAAFQFATQQMDSLKGLMYAVCGYFLANVAVTLL